MKAIQTKYKGYRFRSRLEARWAVFFDALGLAWEYETEGFDLGFGDRYLPDFKIYDTFFEVKPAGVKPHEILKVRRFVEAGGGRVCILDGPPDVRWYRLLGWWEDDGGPVPREGGDDAIIFVPPKDKYAPWFGAWGAGSADDPYELSGVWVGIDDEMQEYVHAARSARFEFGESGAAR